MTTTQLKNITISTEMMDANQVSDFISAEISATATEPTEGASLIGSVTILGKETKFYGSTGGGSISVDEEMSLTSTNPVQNKVITTALSGKVDKEKYEEKEIIYGSDLAVKDTLLADGQPIEYDGFFVKHCKFNNGNKITFYSSDDGVAVRKFQYTEDNINLYDIKVWNSDTSAFDKTFNDVLDARGRLEGLVHGSDVKGNDVFIAKANRAQQLFSTDGKNWVCINDERSSSHIMYPTFSEKLCMFALESGVGSDYHVNYNAVTLCKFDDINKFIDDVKNGTTSITPFKELYLKGGTDNDYLMVTKHIVPYQDGFVLIRCTDAYSGNEKSMYVAGIEFDSVKQRYTYCIKNELNMEVDAFMAGDYIKAAAIGNGKLLWGNWTSDGATKLVIYDFATDTYTTQDLPAGGVMAIRYVNGYFYIATKGTSNTLFKTTDGSVITPISMLSTVSFKTYNFDIDVETNEAFLGGQSKSEVKRYFTYKFDGEPTVIVKSSIDKVLCKKDCTDALKQIGSLDYISKQSTDAATLSCLLDGFNYIIDALKNA